MKPFRALLPRLGGIPRLPSFLLIRDPFSALLFFTHTHTKKCIGDQCIPWEGIFCFVLIYLFTSYLAG